MKNELNLRHIRAACAVAALSASLLTGCQSRPASAPAADRPMTILAPVMSPGRPRIETAQAQPRSEALPVRIQFLPMFAAASWSAFESRDAEVQTDAVFVGEADFLPMFASINSPGRWSAVIDIGDTAIVRTPDNAKPVGSDEPLAGAEGEKNPR